MRLRPFFSYAASMPPRDIGWMFLDLNSYFAGAEQELQPHLRGLPVVVLPVEAESACCIAVSSQAKAYGVRTGLGLAKRVSFARTSRSSTPGRACTSSCIIASSTPFSSMCRLSR